MGAEVVNYDFSRPLDARVLEAFEDALERYGVLIFRHHSPSAAEQIAFSRQFGVLETATSKEGGHESHPELMVVGNPPGRLITFSPANPDGDLEWHADNMHLTNTARLSVLHAIKVPKSGGDTLFACMFAAYDDLSERERREFEQLKMVHSISGLETYLEENTGEASRDAIGPTYGTDKVVWPLVQHHHRTGRKSLYLGSHVTIGVEDWPVDKSRALIRKLVDRATRPEFQLRYRWQQGDVVMWDNRRVLHAGTYYDVRRYDRLLYRTTVRDPYPAT